MDPVNRVRNYLVDNVGHMTYPGNASFDPDRQRWFFAGLRTVQSSLAILR
jgi:hypothetical protein